MINTEPTNTIHSTFVPQPIVRVKLDPGATAPRYNNVDPLTGDAGADIFPLESGTVPAKSRKLIKTGVHMEFAPGYRGRMHSRSGLSLKNGVETGAGLIDNSYRGDIGVMLYNHGDEAFHYSPEKAVSQICIERFEQAIFEVVDELGDSSRGEKGFGSSDRA